MSMFNKASHIAVYGGNFSVQRTELNITFDKLTSKASPLAFHLANSSAVHSTCHPNTRTKILEHLKGWANRKIDRDKFIMWLHGAAGGGKTAIGRTIAQWCEEEGILLGEFFFSRGDMTLSRITSLPATLAYRMATLTLKDAKEAISKVISRDPHIFSASLADQMKKLVVGPLNLLTPCGIVPHVIVLDGLDECLSEEDQQLVLDVISETLYPLNPDLRVLICSRPEPAISTAFRGAIIQGISTSISLSHDVDSDADIRTFLVEQFAKLRRKLLDAPNGEWPTTADIDHIVQKSSGHFIFAATAVKYVCAPRHRHNAVTRLKHVLDLAQLPPDLDAKRHPFAELSALYTLILSTREDVASTVKACAVCLEYRKYFNTISVARLARFLRFSPARTRALLDDLASLFDVSFTKDIKPFHASFSDFLFDKLRSGDFYCEQGDVAAEITCALLKDGRDPEMLSYQTFFRLLKEATPGKELRNVISQIEPPLLFKRDASIKAYSKEGGYYLIPLLRQLEKHVLSDIYQTLVTYFDEQFTSFIFNHCWLRTTFQVDGDDDGLDLMEVSDFSEDDVNSQSGSEPGGDQKETASSQAGPGSGSIKPTSATSRAYKYSVNHLAPLTTSPKWDEVIISAGLNIPLKGSDAVRSVLDEAPFVRSRLPKTSFALRLASTQIKAADFCIAHITDHSTPNNLRLAFSELLPHSLALAGQSAKLSVQLKDLLSHPENIYTSLPSQTQRAIVDYLTSQHPTTASRTIPKPTTVSHSSPSFSNTAAKSSALSRLQPTPPKTHGPSAAVKTQVPPRTPALRPPATKQGPSTTSAPRLTTASRAQPAPRTSQKASITQGPSSASPYRPSPSLAPKSSASPKPKPPASTSQKVAITRSPAGASAPKNPTNHLLAPH